MTCDYFNVECDPSFCGCNRTRKTEDLLKRAYYELRAFTLYKNISYKVTDDSSDKLCDEIKGILNLNE
jgi:hypothetical protein